MELYRYRYVHPLATGAERYCGKRWFAFHAVQQAAKLLNQSLTPRQARARDTREKSTQYKTKQLSSALTYVMVTKCYTIENVGLDKALEQYNYQCEIIMCSTLLYHCDYCNGLIIIDSRPDIMTHIFSSLVTVTDIIIISLLSGSTSILTITRVTLKFTCSTDNYTNLDQLI